MSCIFRCYNRRLVSSRSAGQRTIRFTRVVNLAGLGCRGGTDSRGAEPGERFQSLHWLDPNPKIRSRQGLNVMASCTIMHFVTLNHYWQLGEKGGGKRGEGAMEEGEGGEGAGGKEKGEGGEERGEAKAI